VRVRQWIDVNAKTEPSSGAARHLLPGEKEKQRALLLFPSPIGRGCPKGRVRVREWINVHAKTEPSSGAARHLLPRE
jgi:hypothetical protein